VSAREMDIHDLVEELTRPHTHREKYAVRDRKGTWWNKNHVTHVPSLVYQLQHATPTGSGDNSRSGYQSRPAAWLEGVDTLARIDLEVARWIRELGEDDDTTDTGRLIGQLHGLLASAPRCRRQAPRRDERGKVTCCTAHSIEADVRRWWTQARIITGWDSSPWRPANTCPACGVRGKLRVRFSAEAALCVECRATWDHTTIGLLAEHIRAENADPDVPTTSVG
jgi:hypothetical protein